MHVADAISKGYNNILIRSVDTDIVVLAVAAAAKLDVEELWIAFMEQLKASATYLLMRLLGHLCLVNPLLCQCFHAYTGCDTVSSFSTKGKKSAWTTWMSYDDVTSTFLSLSTRPSLIKM